MGKFLAGIFAATLIAAPAQAGDWRSQAIETQPGTFVGARLQLPLGGNSSASPRAAFTIAPTQSQVSGDGMIRTRIGDGVALGITPAGKPMLTLAGVRADRALGVTREQSTSSDVKLGLSDAGWVAVGIGGALLAGAAAFAIVTHCDESDSSDDCP